MGFASTIHGMLERIGGMVQAGSAIYRVLSPFGYNAHTGSQMGVSDSLWLASAPVTVTASGILLIKLHPNIRCALSFIASHATDPSTLPALVRGVFVDEVAIPPTAAPNVNDNSQNQVEAMGTFAFDAIVTAGASATTLSSSSAFAPTTGVAKFVDAISLATADKTVGGVIVSGDLAGWRAEMTFDTASHKWLLLGINIQSLAGLRVLYRQY